ncbi:Oligopeptide/dipeptide transporter domain family protein [Synechococcus sp. PCC 7335]|uniref:ABC transporter ATP-binding protein n=1 Tax=Synechococcus sp. (strain ATCC 29403 / PCC 7335) TaxID=91464 RepID=UPI00017ECAC5|nr:ABC transporter ATP-binding protein [Synechococcus sp. PCC 7335]EDX86623.1 Oligopeptide/dipeptide transporter domain family protein [Synechococcus sp. PCC 7335]
MALLTVRNLSTQFHTAAGSVSAVNGVSFQVESGETVGIVGESGSGKSVTVLSLTQLLPNPPGKVSAGEAIFDQRDLLKLSDDEMRKIRGNRIAMIFQDPMTSLNPVLTIERQMTEALQLHLKMRAGEARDRAIHLLERVGIPSAAQRIKNHPHQFSGGMRQRVMIAMGLACDPQLLIADEPTTALDVTIQAQIVELVKELRQKNNMAIIWITHDLSLLAGIADRILVMYAGQIVESAPLHPLYENPRHPYTLGLLQSLPRLDEARRTRLNPVKGLPPDLLNYPTGCPFAPRCPFVVEQCYEEDPPLTAVGEAHEAACWVQPRGDEVLAAFRQAENSDR